MTFGTDGIRSGVDWKIAYLAGPHTAKRRPWISQWFANAGTRGPLEPYKLPWLPPHIAAQRYPIKSLHGFASFLPSDSSCSRCRAASRVNLEPPSTTRHQHHSSPSLALVFALAAVAYLTLVVELVEYSRRQCARNHYGTSDLRHNCGPRILPIT